MTVSADAGEAPEQVRSRRALIAVSQENRAAARKVIGAAGYVCTDSTRTDWPASPASLGAELFLIEPKRNEDILAFSRRARALHGAGPIIMAIAKGVDANWRLDAAEAGIDAILPPPLNPETLRQILWLLLDGESLN